MESSEEQGSGLAEEHGGDLTAAEVRFGRPAEGWLDLSTGINPWPYPLPELAATAWTRLPDQAKLADLTAIAAHSYGAGAAAGVAAAPGSQALIQLVARLMPIGRVQIVGYTYREHARCWRAAGHEVIESVDPDGTEPAGDPTVKYVVITNPNNPTGVRTVPAGLLALAGTLAGRGGMLVVDEAFADVDPAISVAAAAGQAGLCVLRSFGKFFGLAGLRLGFALTTRDLAHDITATLGPWAVSGPALAIAGQALADRDWITASRSRLDQQATRLDAILKRAGLRVIGGTSLFRLAAHPRAETFDAGCGRHGILVRHFPDRPAWLRFGLPADDAALLRLETGLRRSLCEPPPGALHSRR